MEDLSLFYEDYERLEGVHYPEGKGVLVLDVAAHYPFSDQKDVMFSVGFSDHNPIETAEDIALPGAVLNHRYPNTDWITVSRKKGRRVSKVGYCLVDDIEKLNQYKYLCLEYSRPSSFTYWLAVPVSIALSPEQPANSLELQVMLDRAFSRIVSEPNITLTVYNSLEKRADGNFYWNAAKYFVESWGGVFGDLKANGKNTFCLEWGEVTNSHTGSSILYRTKVDIKGAPMETIRLPLC